MAFLLNVKPGTFVMLKDPGSVPGGVYIDGLRPDVTPNVAVTSISIRRGIQHQIQQTFNGVVHIHAFGERMGDLGLSGVLFRNSCRTHRYGFGINQVVDYFNSNSLRLRDRPITVAVGTQAARGFLVDISATMQESEISLGSFQLALKLLPPIQNQR